MPEKFEIEVPISVKGVGGIKTDKKIGDSMAAMSKGLKGVIAKFGVLGAAITAAVGLLAKSSPYLKGILDIFGRAFMIFFRPFGDFLATLLRPLAILLMKMAVAFLKWTRGPMGKVREAVENAPQIGLTGMTLPDIPIEIANWALKLGAALGQIIYEIGKGAVNLGQDIGQWLYDQVIVPAGDFLYSKLLGIWNWTKNFAGWLWEQMTNVWNWTYDFGAWIWDKITSVWNWTYDFGAWLWGKITSIFRSGPFGIFGSLFGIGKGQVGIASVPNDGIYQLHKGEEVVPRTKVGSKSIIFKPTFQITGNIAQDIDMDSIVRRAGRQVEMDLKQRGII